MVRDLLGYRIKNKNHLEFVNEMEKYYIYKDNVYQIIRMSKHYKLDGGWYVDIFVRNAYTGKRSNFLMPLNKFREKQLLKFKPRNNNKLKQKNERISDMVSETIDITHEVDDTYFESKNDFIKFSKQIIKIFDKLIKVGYRNICFDFRTGYYTEYGETYPTLNLEFSYDRKKTNIELEAEKAKLKEKLELEKFYKSLEGKLPEDAILGIMSNDTLKQMYLEGKILL